MGTAVIIGAVSAVLATFILLVVGLFNQFFGRLRVYCGKHRFIYLTCTVMTG